MPISDRLFSKKIPFAPSSLETIDASMLKFIADLNLHTMTNRGFKKVPIIWGSAERAFQSKRGQEIRDNRGALILPLISIERTTVEKSLTKKGSVYSNIPPVNDEKGGAIPVAKFINQKKTAEFAAADANRLLSTINFPRPNPKIVYQTISMPLPTYVAVTYEITLRTEYQQQMNDLMSPFISRPGSINYILLKKDGHRFEGFIQEAFNQNNNISDSTNEERKFETKINIEVVGYTIGSGKNQSTPNFVYRESIVEVKTPRERLMLNEIPEHEYGSYYGLSGIDFRKIPEYCPELPFFSNIAAGSTRTTSDNAAGGGGGGDGHTHTGGGAITDEEFKTKLSSFYVQRENLSNSIGSGNRVFNASVAFRQNSEQVFLNGILLFPGASNDYVVSENNQTITISDEYTLQTAAERGAGATGDIIQISYIIA